MKIDLPLEVWVESFESLPRAQLAALLPHIGDEQEEYENRPIADRQFVNNVQFYLHRCGNVTLGWFSIQSSSKGPIFVNKAGQKLLLAKVPQMPSNIKNFKKITINYYDQSVLGFLQEFGRNSLLTDVHLLLRGETRRKFNSMSKTMTRFLPSITSIESINSYRCYDHNAALFQEKYSDMLASTRILNGCHFGFGYDDWYRHWLHIPRTDGKPRILVPTIFQTFVHGIYTILPFIEKIRKDFLDANQAVSFVAYLSSTDANVQSISLDNDKTQEKLVIKANDTDLEDHVTISRYPMGATEEWIEGNAQIIRGIIHRHRQERKIKVNIFPSDKCTCSLI